MSVSAQINIKYNNLLVWQIEPVNPGVQLQLYELTKSTQVALFLHGMLVHSLISLIKKYSKLIPKLRLDKHLST